MGSTILHKAVAAVRAAHDELAALPVDTLSHRELLDVLGELEILSRQLPAQSHRILARLTAEASPQALGAKTLPDVLTTRLRVSRTEAKRRVRDAAVLGPRRSLIGEPLSPVLELTAAAQAAGQIGPEHVAIIGEFFRKLPAWVDPQTRTQAESDLVVNARGLTPEELKQVAQRLQTLIDQDGPMPDDAEQARKRGVWIGKQQADGMTPVHALLDPLCLATLEAVTARLAAPGMCNPYDENPCISGTPSHDQVAGDDRSAAQRNHDALTAMGRSVLSSGELGQHNGLPAMIIVSTTLQDLTDAAGVGVTAGGSLLPMSDVIRLASHAHHSLVVFDKHTARPLYLGRSKRIATADQRIVLLARDRGCTRPGCTVCGYDCQVHHITGWATGGQTNVDTMVLACPADNRLADDGYFVRIRADGSVEWIPPPHNDIGQARTNVYHHPERMLTTSQADTEIARQVAAPDRDDDVGDDEVA
ncbi:HNH endonuclease signature motif containing protein [Mycolicibacterium sarraceniae]|uniref:HNH nuclease domain-containing protein n=1 Tax=Mycolicibacterium sarraceniae TaxID=1534348 RepID=A0A7I7T0D9_9MYCO|nr:HNH endonuclease signature motif containing protein [Mycolicibacterium sarraceniae]BBY61526.1 hypothetical protein MSAR_46620 [Mycolicibacterium sarraceniae]